MQDSRAASFGQDQVTLGCFEVGGRIYAVDVAQVREVVRWRPITPLPGAPTLIEGVVDLRGTVVPVIDLNRALGGAAVEPDPRTRIAVTEIDGMLVGLVVDAAIEVLPVPASLLEDPPALATQAGHDGVRAVVRRADAEPIIVLALEHLLEKVYRRALPMAEAAS